MTTLHLGNQTASLATMATFVDATFGSHNALVGGAL